MNKPRTQQQPPVWWLSAWFYLLFFLPFLLALLLRYSGTTSTYLPFTTPSLTNLKQVLFIFLIYPVLEEIVFRGLLQGELISRVTSLRWRGLSLANVLTSILFALAHTLNQEAFNAMLVFVPSLVFGFCKDRYGSLLPCMVLHGWYNGLLYYTL